MTYEIDWARIRCLGTLAAANAAGGCYRASPGEKDMRFVIDRSALLIEACGAV